MFSEVIIFAKIALISYPICLEYESCSLKNFPDDSSMWDRNRSIAMLVENFYASESTEMWKL